MATGYVTNYGNDDNDGLTWETAKRSIQGAVDVGHDPLEVNGYLNQNVIANVIIINGNGSTVIDGISLGHFNTGISSVHYFYDLEFKNFRSSNWIRAHGRYYRCTLSSLADNIVTTAHRFTESIFHSSDGLTNVQRVNQSTIHKVTRIDLDDVGFEFNNSIISDVPNLDFKTIPTDQLYTLFINCAFKFTGGSGTDETTYTYPTGATDTDKLQNLRDRMATVYGGLASDYLVGCKYYSGSYNDIFVDADNGDFNLVPFCIAAHMSYEGDYIGARPEGTKAEWNTDFSSIVNIDSNGNVIDQTIDASAETSIIDIGHERDVLNFQALGQRAMRNGQQINTETNLGSNIAAGSSVLTDGLTYECVDDTIVRDDSGSTGQNPWETFTAVDEGSGVGLGFSGDGEVKEVYIDDRYEEKVQFKSSKTDNTLAAAVLITSKLHSNPVLVNVDGNGEPTHGDADVGYVEGTAIPLRSRYIQFFIKIKANNLPAR